MVKGYELDADTERFLKDNPELAAIFAAAFKLGAIFGFKAKEADLSLKEMKDYLEKWYATPEG